MDVTKAKNLPSPGPATISDLIKHGPMVEPALVGADENIDDTAEISDKARLAQIFINIISNSIKYSKKGGISLSVAIDRKITIKVSDTGIGIDNNKIDTIFQPFTRIDSEFLKSQTGLGLGLSIVSQIINMMKGTIHVESEQGKGSTFTVELPHEKTFGTNAEIASAGAKDFSII
ncbi:MAG: ATP-binding protein, partial [Roseovarius sp.]|nr:ATP-binding protein [Roseovarius sp.]